MQRLQRLSWVILSSLLTFIVSFVSFLLVFRNFFINLQRHSRKNGTISLDELVRGINDLPYILSLIRRPYFYNAGDKHAYAEVIGADYYPVPFTAAGVTQRESSNQRTDKKVQEGLFNM